MAEIRVKILTGDRFKVVVFTANGIARVNHSGNMRGLINKHWHELVDSCSYFFLPVQFCGVIHLSCRHREAEGRTFTGSGITTDRASVLFNKFLA